MYDEVEDGTALESNLTLEMKVSPSFLAYWAVRSARLYMAHYRMMKRNEEKWRENLDL